ncbi:ATP-binding cassette domain-containing protein [Trueperella abortisuis]|uniref:ABC-type transport system involved in cytochrome bd biosynthesis fused ATPase/permease subunit n=1 Tax=Trueperella abortisuis TaxID=445930 RepID=A0ABT9PHC5_9ACTO|nr:ATP-binding cassette domain-containing protein [Trueperella abortisuis]MDP9831350.1 ABC-type transport system involved in cytochrome bd biosynthesis fused ATPase/permease subunit [Trueperella abortisuis]
MTDDVGVNVQTLELRNVSTLLPNGRRTAPVSASLARGDVLWLRGDVGIGKTSFVRALIGLGEELDGEILVDGAAGALAPGQVFLMPQVPSILSGKVTENITLDRPDLDMAARGGLTDARMGYLVDQELGPGGLSLSGGERHVVAWLRHLRRTGGVRVLDEPFNGLSPEAAAHVMAEIEESRADWITILISHDDRPAQIPGVSERRL